MRDDPLTTKAVAIGLPVADLERATAWYARVLGAEPAPELVPGVREFEVRPGCTLQLLEQEPPPAGARVETVVRLGVADIEGAHWRLRRLGVDVGAVERVEEAFAFCDFADPDGNALGLYQVL
jgi:catechol 2,3-dioxygenase-like lactoylglutathione lyase family enzyme